MGSALRGPRQKDYCRFKASLGYTVSHRPDYKARPDLKKKKIKSTTTTKIENKRVLGCPLSKEVC